MNTTKNGRTFSPRLTPKAKARRSGGRVRRYARRAVVLGLVLGAFVLGAAWRLGAPSLPAATEDSAVPTYSAGAWHLVSGSEAEVLRSYAARHRTPGWLEVAACPQRAVKQLKIHSACVMLVGPNVTILMTKEGRYWDS